MSSKKQNKNRLNYGLPSAMGIDVMELLSQVKIEKIPNEEINPMINFFQELKKEQEITNPEQTSQSKKINMPPPFTLEIGVPANNIAKQLKKQNIEFDPSVIKTYDKLIKGIVGLRNEKFISKKKSVKMICAVYEKSVNHVSFIYEMFVKSEND
jgi:hypothetical protein